MSERLNEFFGFDVRERLIQLGYTKEEEITRNINFFEQLLDTLNEITEREGEKEASRYLNNLMVKKFMVDQDAFG